MAVFYIIRNEKPSADNWIPVDGERISLKDFLDQFRMRDPRFSEVKRQSHGKVAYHSLTVYMVPLEPKTNRIPSNDKIILEKNLVLDGKLSDGSPKGYISKNTTVMVVRNYSIADRNQHAISIPLVASAEAAATSLPIAPLLPPLSPSLAKKPETPFLLVAKELETVSPAGNTTMSLPPLLRDKGKDSAMQTPVRIPPSLPEIVVLPSALVPGKRATPGGYICKICNMMGDHELKDCLDYVPPKLAPVLAGIICRVCHKAAGHYTSRCPLLPERKVAPSSIPLQMRQFVPQQGRRSQGPPVSLPQKKQKFHQMSNMDSVLLAQGATPNQKDSVFSNLKCFTCNNVVEKCVVLNCCYLRFCESCVINATTCPSCHTSIKPDTSIIPCIAIRDKLAQ